MTLKIRNFIGGTLVDAVSGETTDLVDPCTGEVYGTAARSGQADVDAATSAAAAAFETWRDSTPSERQLAMLRIADAIEARAEEFVAAESANTGKPLELTMSEEIGPMVDQIRFFAGAARTGHAPAAGEYLAGHTSSIRREPIGVVAQVAPWNYPMMMAVWKWAPAIAAGNTVVLKPSDTTPVTTVMMAELMSEFLPSGVMNVICGDRETGRELVAHPVPQLVSITGSVRAGIEVAKQAAESLKRCHLELGGKAPVVVFGDADLEAAAEAIAVAGYFNAGQDCTAATRVLVADEVYDEFVALLSAQARGTSTGFPDDPDVLYGPLNNIDQFNRVTGFFDRIPDHAVLQAGGQRVGDRGFFVAPTVISGLRQDDELIQTEVFGPVITAQRFADESEAVRFANGTPYGLASSVWTSNHGRAMRMSRALDFGCVWINTHIPLVAEMPHGGFKMSGYGKDLSAYALDDYTRIKHVMSNIEG
ncbi:MAG: aminobutyraldehyde dehydrogenase [Actinobacteria bacterium]|nr:aminobutyraldehyde dehydrogenase [Actinomycetota bacterium]